MSRFKITTLRPCPSGALLAFFDVDDLEFGLRFRGFKLFKGETGVFVKGPNYEYGRRGNAELRYGEYISQVYDAEAGGRIAAGAAFFKELAEARYAWRWIERRGEPVIRRRDLYRGMPGRFPHPTDLDPALALLVEHGFLREKPTSEKRGPGRKPSPEYEVNPLALRDTPIAGPGGGHNGHNGHNPAPPSDSLQSVHSVHQFDLA